jgi:hypothetical protein
MLGQWSKKNIYNLPPHYFLESINRLLGVVDYIQNLVDNRGQEKYNCVPKLQQHCVNV